MLTELIGEYVRACFTGLWIQSYEHEDALAEIAELCRQEEWRLAVPVARTAAESVERLRTWADGRCLSADQPGMYRRSGAVGIKPSRKVSRDPSDN